VSCIHVSCIHGVVPHVQLARAPSRRGGNEKGSVFMNSQLSDSSYFSMDLKLKSVLEG
jgi:hypothetical protein